jgi:hypothetical protein
MRVFRSVRGRAWRKALEKVNKTNICATSAFRTSFDAGRSVFYTTCVFVLYARDGAQGFLLPVGTDGQFVASVVTVISCVPSSYEEFGLC